VRKLRKLIASLASEGLGGTISLVTKNAQFQYRLWLDRQFDRRFGTETSGRVELDSLTVLGENRARGVYFESTPTALFRFFLSNITVDHAKFTFVDLGSGKGRTLLMASDYPFKRIVGVEFSRELHERALANIAVYRSASQSCIDIRSVNADATSFEFPATPLFVYAYNPFDEQVMTAVLRNLLQSLAQSPRETVLMYYNPRWWVMEQFPQLPLATKLAVPLDRTREVQRPAAVYANFELPRASGWL
jgi:SAM-dependent methyltransferase